jgi:hypothetical protein
MKKKTEKDFWIEMSIREIWTQCHFAELAYKNIYPKARGGTDGVFSSIHSFLSHCAMVSKMLKAQDETVYKNVLLKTIRRYLNKLDICKIDKSDSIGEFLGISWNSIIHNRKFRNRLEHYDKELKLWIRKKGINSSIGTYNIGPKSMIQIPNIVFISHYDPRNTTFTFIDEDIDLSKLYADVKRIKELADKWGKKNATLF